MAGRLIIRLGLALWVGVWALLGLGLGLARLVPEGGAVSYAQFNRGEGSRITYIDVGRGARFQMRYHERRLDYVSADDQIRPDTFDQRITSPDGLTTVQARQTGGSIELFLLDKASGETLRQITYFDAFPPIEGRFRSARSNTYPVWSPDGTGLVFISMDWQAQMDIFYVRPDGTALRRLAQDVDSLLPVQLRWHRIVSDDAAWAWGVALALAAGALYVVMKMPQTRIVPS